MNRHIDADYLNSVAVRADEIAVHSLRPTATASQQEVGHLARVVVALAGHLRDAQRAAEADADAAAPRWARGEHGQTLPLIVLFMVCLIGMAGMAIDVGSWYEAKVQAQATADASALAGTAAITGNWSAAAQNEFNANARARMAPKATYALTTNVAPSDSVTVTVDEQAPAYFSSVFGFGGVHVHTLARATAESIQSAGGITPFAIPADCYVVGQKIILFGGTCGTSSSNAGAIQMPAAGVIAAPGNCNYTTAGSGESTLESIIAGTTPVGTLEIGSCLSKTKTGNGPNPGKPLSAPPWSNEAWPVQVLVPVISTSYGNGSQGNLTVVAFAWVGLTGCSGGTGPASCSGNGGKEIDGVVTGVYDGPSGATPVLGAYVPGYVNDLGLTR